MGADENRQEGKIFEDIFVRQAMRNGLLPIKNYLSAKHTYNGRVQVMKSELDFTLINQEGHVAFVDCKSFGNDYFTYSQLDRKQVERAMTYNHWKVPSGFVVYFRPVNRIVYFTGGHIEMLGAGARFTALGGVQLGSFQNFDLKRVLNP